MKIGKSLKPSLILTITIKHQIPGRLNPIYRMHVYKLSRCLISFANRLATASTSAQESVLLWHNVAKTRLTITSQMLRRNIGV